jgi:hypothetical protein
MSTDTSTTPASLAIDPESEPLDVRTRLILAGAAAVGLLILAAIGLVVFAAFVANWNFLNWME